MKILPVFLLILTQHVFSQQVRFEKIEMDTCYSFRGLSVVDDSIAWVSGNGFGRSTNGGKTWRFQKVKNFEKSDFRTLYAFDAQHAILANAGSPAYILYTSDGGLSWKTVYENSDSLAFFDGIDFWNEEDGIIYGDPINGRMLLLCTNDGGLSWKELPEKNCPKLSDGEASFAASGTGIRCFGKGKMVIATGGEVSRLLISNDKAESWTSVTVPILHGKNSTGIFSFTFINDSLGIVVGGDYLADTLRDNHVFYTVDGGKSWNLPSQLTGGYRECVEFISENTVIAVGPGGTDISYDAGKNWIPVEGEKYFHVIRKARRGKLVIAAGIKKIRLVKVDVD